MQEVRSSSLLIAKLSITMSIIQYFSSFFLRIPKGNDKYLLIAMVFLNVIVWVMVFKKVGIIYDHSSSGRYGRIMTLIVSIASAIFFIGAFLFILFKVDNPRLAFIQLAIGFSYACAAMFAIREALFNGLKMHLEDKS